MRRRKFVVHLKRIATAEVEVMAKDSAEAEEKVQETIEEAWDFDEVAEWGDGIPGCDIEITHVNVKHKARRKSAKRKGK